MSCLIRLTESSRTRLPPEVISQKSAKTLLAQHGRRIDVQWPSPRNGEHWELTVGPWVGHVPVDDELTLALEPKVPIANLFAMLEYAFHLESFELLKGEIELSTLEDFYDRIAQLFCSLVLDRERRGLYKAYVSRVDDLSFVRGRLEVHHHLRRPLSVTPRCRFQDHSADVEDNQLLAWTLLVVARTMSQESRSLPLARRAFRALSGRVSPRPFSPADCAGRLYHRLNQDYSVLHGLCRFFLEHTGPTHEIGERAMLPFLVNMAQLYERFVAQWLAAHLTEGVTLKAQERLRVGDEGQLRFDIDMVLSDAGGSPLVVLDTKYKDVEHPAKDDVYQVVTYAVAKGCREAILVYPRSQTIPLDTMVGEIRVRSLTFSLGGDLEEAGQRFLDRLALSVFRGASPTGPATS